MNKWSKSLPSINKTKLNIDPIGDDDNDSLTDVSIIIQTKSSKNIYKTSVDQKSIGLSKYDQFVPDDQLFQSLIDYANSFNFDETIYSIQDLKTQLNPPKQRTYSSTNLNQHKTYSNNSVKLIPSKLFSTRKTDSEFNDESTTITDGSKFEWEYLSDTIDHSNKSLKNTQKISPSPIIIREILPKPSSKPPINPKRKIMYDTKPYKRHADEQSKQIIIEYDRINVSVDRNKKQFNSFSNKTFQNFRTSFIM